MEEKDFVTFEYKTVSVKAEQQPKCADLYEAFGWEIISAAPSMAGNVVLSLKRDRKLKHKQELKKVERQAEEVSRTLERLERSKTAGPSGFAYLFGIVAALVLGGGMCLVMLTENNLPALIGGIVLGIAGIVLCGVNYLIYKKGVERRLKRVLPAVDENEEKLADLLEKGNDLLRADLI